MASSQVEIASSSSPFGCVLRDHNLQNPYSRETNVQRWRDLGGVSSLVRRWRDFETEARNLSSNNLPVCNTSRCNSTSTFAENVSTSFPEIPPRDSDDACESVDERYETPTMHEDSFPDWESDLTATSSSGRTDSDATEMEKLRVVDIIRRLTCSGEDNSNDRDQAQGVINKSMPRVHIPLDQCCFPPMLNSPKIRGRQAFSDLLMQMESERHKELEGLVERKAVSKFSQRGRIQALLRVRFLRRGAEGAEVRGRQDSNSMASESNRQTQGSSIMHLRERFNTGVEHGASEPRNPTRDGSRSPRKEVIINSSDTGNSSNSHQFRDSNIQQEVKTTIQESTLKEAAHTRSDVRLKETSHEISNLRSQENTEKVISLNGLEDNMDAELQDSDNQNQIGTCHDSLSDQDSNNQHLRVNAHGWMSDVSQPQSECEARNYDYQQPDETTHDWIHDISRPRSDWEGLRQVRYQEMLDPYLDNDDIHQLLKRRSVSTFLSSGLRERIEQLMLSRTQRAPQQIDNQIGVEDVEEGKKDEVVEEEEKENNEQEEEEDDDEDEYDDDDEDEEDESHIGRIYNEVGDYSNRTTSSFQLPITSLSRPWSHNRDHEISDSDQVASPSLQHSISSDSYTRDNRQCSSFRDHCSIEMELLYDLRGQMEQLRQEMSELQRSIKSCMNMQTAVSHSEQREGRDSLSRDPTKGNCCICYEMQIDSLLYRCGHMCTCFKCAYELQCSTGKCPICRAPIVDVVRAHLVS